MRKYNKFRPKTNVARYGRFAHRKPRTSATRKAYLAGVKAGRRMARSKRRWY